MSSFELAFAGAHVDQVAGQLLWTTAKVACVLMLAGLVLRCLPSAKPSTRHAIWMVAFGTALFVPVLETFGPRWHLLPPSPTKVSSAPIVTKPMPAPRVAALDSLRAPAAAKTRLRRSEKVQPPAAARTQPAQGIRWSMVLLIVWGLGLAWLSIKLVAGAIAVARLRSATLPADSDWDAPLQAALRISRVRHAPELRIAQKHSVPMLVGLWRRMVILPPDAADWSFARKVAVLQHELAHLRRFDLETGLLAQVLCILHWLNPLVWPARRQMLYERERACDDAVLASGVSPADYAAQILEVARGAVGNYDQPATAAMASRSELEGRLHSILDRQRSRRSASWMEKAGVVFLALLIGTPIASLSLTAPAMAATATQQRSNAFPNAEDAWTARRTLDAQSDPEEIFALAAMVDDPDDRARLKAVKALGRYSAPSAVEALDAFAEDSDPLVREWTARSLAMVGRQAGSDTLLYLLDDSEPDVREWAVRALASVTDERAVDALATSLRDDVPDVREWAARSLMAYNDPMALDALVDNLLNDSVPDVREWAARSLGSMGDPAAIEALESAAFDEEPEVREWAVRALGEVNHPATVDALTEIMYDGYPDVQEWAARGLGARSDEAGYDVLYDVLTSDAFEPDARAQAALAFGRSQRVEAVNALQDALQSDSEELREAADEALALLEDAPQPLEEAVDLDPNEAAADESPMTLFWTAVRQLDELATQDAETIDPWLALALQYVDDYGIDADDARRLATRAIRKRDDFLRRYGNRDADRGAEWVEEFRERYLIDNLERMRAAQRR